MSLLALRSLTWAKCQTDAMARDALTGSSLVTCWSPRRGFVGTHVLGVEKEVVSQVEMRTWH